jgi:heme/copper-type cytochrome/quinol oxidase subunit 4
MNITEKTYLIAFLLLVLTLTTFGFVLPAAVSFESDIVIILAIAYVALIYIPVALKMTRYIINNIGEILEKFKNE